MSHVPYLETDQAAESIRPTFEGIEKKLGRVSNFLKVLAYHPPLFEAFLPLDGSLRKMSLDPKLRELAYLTASRVNDCDYCRSHHEAGARKAGLDERQIADVLDPQGSASYDEHQRLVLAFAEQVTRTGRADPGVIAGLKGFLDDRRLVELTATVALANFTNRINTALDIELP